MVISTVISATDRFGKRVGYKTMSKKETWAIASEIESDHPETAFRLRLMYLFRHQRRTDRSFASDRGGSNRRVTPTRPRVFYDLLWLCYVAPLPEHVESALADYQRRQAVDKAFKNFVVAARQLNSLLPEMAHYHPLIAYMEGRLPVSEEHRNSSCQFLEQLQSFLTLAKRAPALRARPFEEKPPSVKDGYVRDVVRAVCWYLEEFEGEAPTTSALGGASVTGRAGILSILALEALGINISSSLTNQVRAVVTAADWRRPGYGWWDNIPTTARPS